MNNKKIKVNKNFTKLTHKGVSLIVLIVTIIVIVILAVTVILTLSNNNPIESAREAQFKEDIRVFQDELLMNISKEYISTQGKREYKVSTKKYDLIKEYIPSFSKKYENKLVINKDEIKYIGDNVTEKEKKWLTSLNISEKNKTAADIVKESPKSYYQKVILNYTTDHEKTENAVNKWKIFYSDGDNVYLIADNYISKDYVPNGRQGTVCNCTDGDFKFKLDTSVIKDYNGSGDITDKRLKALNNEWFKNFESNNPNMKAVAYLMDISENVWGSFKGKYADYAIGAPTLQMLFDSCNEYYGRNYKIRAINENGYEINVDGQDEWVDNKYFLLPSSSDSIYVIKSRGSSTVFIATPSIRSKAALHNVTFTGSVSVYPLLDQTNSFRPIICLNSDVMLKEVDGGYNIEL